MTMKSKIRLILLTFTALLFLAYSGGVTSSYFRDNESTAGNVLRVKIAPLFGAADSFAVLAGTGITNTGATTVSGDVGTYPTVSETGFGPGADSVTFTAGINHAGDAVTQQAKTDLTSAYNDAAGRTPFTTVTGDTLGSLNLGPGIYRGGALSLSGTLTLTGDANAVWIFQAASTLDTAAGSQIMLNGGAKAANIYWVVGSSATLGADSAFKGSILAYASITMYAGAAVEGRALAQTGAVTLNANTITKSAP